MSNNIICPVIMAGGSGSRLWPLSRLFYPKQFLKLVDDSSMLRCPAGDRWYLQEQT